MCDMGLFTAPAKLNPLEINGVAFDVHLQVLSIASIVHALLVSFRNLFKPDSVSLHPLHKEPIVLQRCTTCEGGENCIERGGIILSDQRVWGGVLTRMVVAIQNLGGSLEYVLNKRDRETCLLFCAGAGKG